MHPRIYHILGVVCFMLCCGLWLDSPSAHAAPQAGLDCRTASSGNWNVPATWENCGGGVPGAGDAAFIQASHTVTLTQNAAVGDLHISTGTTGISAGGDGKVALESYVLDIYGKLRCYYAALGATPGTASGAIPSNPITVTPANPGRLRFAGSSRSITAAGEWSAGNNASDAAFRVEVAVDSDAVVTLGAPVKASNWLFTSGVVDAGTNRVAVDLGGYGTGDVNVAAAATLISAPVRQITR